MSQERKNLKLVSLVILALAIASIIVGIFLLVRTDGLIMESLVGCVIAVAVAVMSFVAGLAANRGANTPSKAKSPAPYAAAAVVGLACAVAGMGVGVPKAHLSAVIISGALCVLSVVALVMSRGVYEKSLK